VKFWELSATGLREFVAELGNQPDLLKQCRQKIQNDWIKATTALNFTSIHTIKEIQGVI
jgi:hypothetical protein